MGTPQYGAKVINASWGDTEYNQVLYDAIQEARDNGVLFVASAGNNRLDNDTSPYSDYPASFDLDNIISVGAMEQDGLLASFSNYGPTTVDIVAPGTNILSDYPAQIVDTSEYFSTWHRGPGWDYQVKLGWNSFIGEFWGYYGELINRLVAKLKKCY
jgi:subtilisin family serine protease